MFDYKGERMPVPTQDTLAKKSEIGSLPRVWSDEPSTPNRFVDGNRQLGFAARTWVRSDTSAVYAYKGYDVQTRTHSWFADTDTKLTYNAATGEIASNGYLIATVETGLDPWRNKFASIEVREGLTFTYTDDASIFIVGKFAFLTDIPSVPVKSVNTKTGEITLTGADIAVSGNDQTKINVALAGKASDADVVHKTGNETIAGEKTFTSPTNLADGSQVGGGRITRFDDIVSPADATATCEVASAVDTKNLLAGKLDKSGGTADNLLICGTNKAIKFDDDLLYIYHKINGTWIEQNVWDLRTSQDGIVALLSDIYDAVQ